MGRADNFHQNMPDKNEHLKFLIERFDHYYDSVNNKGNAMLVINTFSIGGIAAFYTAFQDDVTWTGWLKFFGIALCLLWAASLFFTSWALLPYQKSGSNSLVFFGDISSLTEANFQRKFSAQQDADITTDLQRQVYLLSKGLAHKFRLLRRATYLLFVSYAVLILASIALIINLK